MLMNTMSASEELRRPRVWSIVKGADQWLPAQQVLWDTLDLCDASTSSANAQGDHSRSDLGLAGLFGNVADPVTDVATAPIICPGPRCRDNDDKMVPALAALKIDVMVRRVPAATPNTPIVGALTTRYPALARSLQALTIANNPLDESAALGAFAAVATALRELTFLSCGLTSMEGLASRCEHLRKLYVEPCRTLTSLSGLEGHTRLEEVDFSGTAISSLEPLRTCPALIKVSIRGCRQLTSLSGLDDHLLLEEVDTTASAVASLAPLLSCPVLSKVILLGCRQLSSLEGLEHHARLKEVTASWSAITSLNPLLTCPALTNVTLYHNPSLVDVTGLQNHPQLREIDLCDTPITSIESLGTCPALTTVYLNHCRQLDTLAGLEGHQGLKVLHASGIPITSVEPLRTCPALTLVNCNDCRSLTSLEGLAGHACLETVFVAGTAITSVHALLDCHRLRKLDLSRSWLPNIDFLDALADAHSSLEIVR